MEQHDDDAPWRRPVARRSVLLAGGTVAVLAGIRSAGLSLLADPVGDPTATLHLVRPQDMLVIDFDFYNLRPDLAANPALLRRIDSSVRSFIVARLDSQHVTEQTVFEGQRPPDPGSAAAKAVAGSRIAFVVPETVKSLPYSEEGLLRWWQWIMQAMRTPGVPGPLQTDLLIVDWLHISPDRLATWSHAAAPVTHGNRTELWHSRLALRGQDGRPVESLPLARPPDTAVPTVRAVHADTPTVQEKGLFQTLLPGGDDSVPGQIVQLSSNPAVDVHKPVRADLLSISAAGATVDLDGSWQPTAQPGLNVKRWDHHAWQGRDNKVVIEQYVFLVPTGHRAILVTETERLLDDQTGVAYLRQRQFIRPSERVKRFPGADQPHQGRAFPLREVTITNPVLPDLPAPAQREEVVPGSAGAYWIQDINAVRDGGHSDVVFTVVATDLAGRRIELSTPMAYILADRAVNPADPLLAAVIARLGGYAGIVGTTPDRRRVLDLRGQQVAYVAEQAADTASFPTRRWFWGLEGSTGDPHPLVPRFYPVLLCAEAQVPAIDAVIGPGGPAYLVHDDVYLAQGLEHNPALGLPANKAQIYMRVQDSVDSIAKLKAGTPGHDKALIRNVDSTAKSGAVAAPHLAVGALSLPFGVMSGKQKAIDKVVDDGKIRFKDYFDFDELDQLERAVLFGGIFLGNLIADFDISEPGTPTKGALKIKKKTDYPHSGSVPGQGEHPTGQTTTLEWSTPLVSDGAFRAVEDKTTLTLECVHKVDYLTRETEGLVTGSVTDFSLALPHERLAFIVINFRKVEFGYRVGSKPSFDPQLDSVKFAGPFEFINVLETFFGDLFGGIKGPGGGIKGKPKLDIGTEGVKLGGQLSIPGVQLGWISVSGIAFWAAIVLPFDGSSVLFRFAFSSPDNPFKATVYGLGGGGHFAVELATDEIRAVEASIEFVGNVGADLVVAAGRLTVEIGIFYRNQGAPSDQVVLRGFMRATGRLSVLGLLNLSVEFYAAIQLVDENNERVLFFKAHVIVSVDILFIHESVGIEFQKVLWRSSDSSQLALPGPTRQLAFGELVSQDDWNVCCDSFAA